MLGEDLAAWVRRKGGDIHGLQVSMLPDGGRGLVASRDLSPGELLIRLPHELLVTGDMARAAPEVEKVLSAAQSAGLYESLAELTQSDDDAVAIMLLLIAEKVIRMRRNKAPESAQSNLELGLWIDSLPDVIWTPQTIPEEALETFLDGSPILSLAQSLREELRTIYDELVVPFAIHRYPDVFPADLVTYELFLWAHSVTETRGFDGSFKDPDNQGEESEEESSTGTMLTPFADMANHACEAESVNAQAKPWFPVGENRLASRGFQLSAKRHIPKGSEVFISYGNLQDSHLLLHYGFANGGRLSDGIPISLSEPAHESVDLCTKFTLLMGLAGGGELGTEHKLTIDDPLPRALVASMRMLLMTPEEAEPATIRTNFNEPLTRRNEQDMLRQLGRILDHLHVPSVKTEVDVAPMLASFKKSCDLHLNNLRSIVVQSRALHGSLLEQASSEAAGCEQEEVPTLEAVHG